MIEVESVYINYLEKADVLKNISLKVKSNEFIIIKGDSGAGKSTLLSCIAGLIKPRDGRIIIDGKSINETYPSGTESIRRSTIGYLPQENCLINSMSLIENICLPIMLESEGYDWDEVRQKAIQLIEMIGLKGKESDFPSELSGGEQRRAEIVRLLMRPKKIVMIDEPTKGLDKRYINIINDVIAGLKERHLTLVISTHEDSLITDYVDHVYILDNGSLYEKHL